MPRDRMENPKVRVVDATPEEYIVKESDRFFLSNLGSATVELTLNNNAATAKWGIETTAVSRSLTHGWIKSVNEVRFSGLVIPRLFEPGFEAVGAFIEGEMGTGFLHVLDSNNVPGIFK
jgi:hypothetical protein